MNTHRKLEAWQACRVLAREIYHVTRGFPAEGRFGLTAQLRRAVVSAAANIAEGWARLGPRESAHAVSIALGSLAELDTLFAIAEDLGYITHAQWVALELHRSRASKLTFGLSAGLRRSVQRQRAPSPRATVPPSP